MERFNNIFDYILSVEGGYSNDKYDAGGKTKYGIIEVEARKYGYKGDMRDLTKDFAKNIYYKKYYLGNKLNEVKSDKIALSICDWIVNSGAWGAKKAQQALNGLGHSLVVDGKIGAKTLSAINSVNETKFLERYHQLQRLFYSSIVKNKPSQQRFLKGWLNRVARKENWLKKM